MQTKIPSLLSDPELIAAVAKLAASERRTTVALIAHLAELDARRLHRGAGFPSLFMYCTQVLLAQGKVDRPPHVLTRRAFEGDA